MSNIPRWLAIDIGGANLKVADGLGYAASRRFELWRNPQGLSQAMRAMFAEAPQCDRIVASMTGELADCYANRREGVLAILAALEEAADGRHTRVYLTSGQLVTPAVARRQAHLAGASNWHALASYLTGFLQADSGLLLDIGSTTTDILPLVRGTVLPPSTDLQRLRSGQLVYTGVVRTPLCAVLPTVPYRGDELLMPHEFFATMRDVYVILGDLPEDSVDCGTADERPATKAASRARLGRSICADDIEFHHKDAVTIAKYAAQRQAMILVERAQRVVAEMGSRPGCIVVSGQGEFLAKRVVQQLGYPDVPCISVAERLSKPVSLCAPAHALAVLAQLAESAAA